MRVKRPTPQQIHDLHHHLTAIPDLYRQLPTLDEPDRGNTTEPGDEPGHHPAPSPPVNLNVIHLADTRLKTGWRTHNPGRVATIERFGTLPALMWWTYYLEARMNDAHLTPPHGPDPANVDTECAWLLKAEAFALAQPWAIVLCNDIERLHNRLNETVTGKRTFIPRCGTCPNTTLEPQDAGSWYKCPTCNRDYTPSRMGDLGRRQPPLPGKEIAAILGIPWATLRTWEARGLIKAERKAHGKNLYNLADVKRAQQRTRT